MAIEPQPSSDEPRDPYRLVRLLFGTARMLMIIGTVTLIIAAAVLLLTGAVGVLRYVGDLLFAAENEIATRKMFLASIKLVDLTLLATVLLVVAFGLYALFIDDRIPVPRWLRTGDVDKLKQKLAGIVVVMLGVLFLELVITGVPAEELLYSGGAIAMVMLALSYFIGRHPPRD